MADVAPRRRIDPSSRPLLRDLQSYLFFAGKTLELADVMKAFPQVDPMTIIVALADLESEKVVSLQVRHTGLRTEDDDAGNGHHPENGQPLQAAAIEPLSE